MFWAIASVCMAITLPTSSYSAYETTNVSESFTLGIGSSITNTYMASAGDYARGTCTVDKQDPNAIYLCEQCCIGTVLMPCAQQGGTEATCGPAYKECINDCMGASLPLGSPLLLLPFALVYALVRRKRNVVE